MLVPRDGCLRKGPKGRLVIAGLGAGTFSIIIIFIFIIILISTHRLVRRIAPQGHDESVQKIWHRGRKGVYFRITLGFCRKFDPEILPASNLDQGPAPQGTFRFAQFFL